MSIAGFWGMPDSFTAQGPIAPEVKSKYPKYDAIGVVDPCCNN